MEKNNRKVIVKVPARFHIDVMNIQKLEEGKVGGGGIGIAIDCKLTMSVEIIDSKTDIIESIKPNLVQFYIELLREHLKFDARFYVKCQTDNELKTHGGMGSNALVQLGIAYAINYLMKKPLSEKELIKLLQNNYFEEENGIVTNHVFCSGVAHNTVVYGGVCFVSEEGELIYNKKLPKEVAVGAINAEFNEVFENENIDKDEIVVNLRKDRDKKQGIKNKKYIIENMIIKDLKNNKYNAFIRGMKKFSKEDDSVALSKKCKINKLKYEEFCEIIENIGNTFVRISSNSPYIYIATDSIEKIKQVCQKYDINIKQYEINNQGIQIIEV